MRYIYLILWLFSSLMASAQVVAPPNITEPVLRFGQLNKPVPGCGTRPKKPLAPIPAARQARIAQKSGALPYCVKVVLTVFADNDGSNRASTDADQLRQFNAMVNFYRPHNICFVLMGIRQINNSDLNIQDRSEEDELTPFLLANVFNIFTHKEVYIDGKRIGGTAYDIPNTGAYVSLDQGNVSNASDNVTMAHEVGHAFGLLHTFERHAWDPLHDTESVERNPDADCWDCDVDGDYVCDTPADPDQDEDDVLYLRMNTTDPADGCRYVGNRRDECDVPYVPQTYNIMSYGRPDCITLFTNGQGARMRYYLSEEADFARILAPEALFLPVLGPQILAGGSLAGVSRDVFTLGESYPLRVQQTAVFTIYSKRIVVKPGTRFSPGSGGRVQLTGNPNCP
nr:hypothetical protein [uncultured Arsenicibacter sp.]